MKIQLDDNKKHLKFAPISLTRPIGDIRIGILTNTERWTLLVPDASVSFGTESYLSGKFVDDRGDVIVNACVIPDKNLSEAILALKGNEELVKEGMMLARKGTGDVLIEYSGEVIVFEERWHIYQKNGQALQNDFDILTEGRTSVQLSSTNTIIGDPNKIFLEPGARVEACILNTNNGPIYIGNDAEIMEGSIVRGPLAMCHSSVLKLGSKVYGPTTLGPFCKAGGELNNVVFQAYSNKGHDGFLGNSVVGEWCNIGADTNTSNLKNNYSNVKAYSFETEKLEQTDVQFMGLFMGDHSKCGINTMFNTATVVGVSCNVFGAEFPPKYIPSFTWGTQGDRFDLNKSFESANNMMSRRGKDLTQAEQDILRHISDSN
jgi:UDP-N-acetylglucosamine diphosphorylase/glucosamine-1-phosphate N-acetyltransferase